MSSPDQAWQEGLFDLLSNDADLMAVVTGVYDRAPQASDSGSGTPFPYILIGVGIATEDDVSSAYGTQILQRLHVYSRTGSRKQTQQIQGLIYSALHDKIPYVAGFAVYSVLRESSRVQHEEDGTFHGICEYRALIEQ